MTLFLPTTPFTPQEVALLIVTLAALILGVAVILRLFRRLAQAQAQLTASMMRYADVSAEIAARRRDQAIIAALEDDDDDDDVADKE